jgi:hypothetical protein
VPARVDYKSHILDGVVDRRNPLPDFRVYVPPDPVRDKEKFKALSALQSWRSDRVDAASAQGRYAGLPSQGMTKSILDRRVGSMRSNILFSIDGRNGGIELTNNEVSAILQLHFGLERRFAFHGEIHLRKCPSATIYTHALGSCKFILTFRHDEGVMELAGAFREAGIHGRISTNPTSFPIADLGPGRVPAGAVLHAIDGDREVPVGAAPPPPVLYPADTLIHGVRGSSRDMAVDFTVVNTEAYSNNGEDIQKVLLSVHQAKHKKYDFSCRQHGVEFHPIVMTHLGVLLEASSVTISVLLGINKPVPGVFPSVDQSRRMLIKKNLLNKLACIAAKHYARSIIMHAPEPASSTNSQ